MDRIPGSAQPDAAIATTAELGPAAGPGPRRQRTWRHRLLAALTSWNRYQVGRVIEGVILIWLVGAVVLYLAERRGDPGFSSFVESLWSVWALLFSGLDDAYTPHTVIGRVTPWSCWSPASGWPACSRRAWPRCWSNATCGGATCPTSRWTTTWCSATGPRGLEWIREVHSKIIAEPRPIVIIHDNPDEIDLPDKQDEPAFNDVYIVKGDPTSEVILNRATVVQGVFGRRSSPTPARGSTPTASRS